MGVGVDGENSGWGGPAFCDQAVYQRERRKMRVEGKCGRAEPQSGDSDATALGWADGGEGAVGVV